MKKRSIKTQLTFFTIAVIAALSVITVSLLGGWIVNLNQYNHVIQQYYSFTALSNEINQAYIDLNSYIQNPNHEIRDKYSQSMDNAKSAITDIKDSSAEPDIYYAMVGIENMILEADRINREIMEQLNLDFFNITIWVETMQEIKARLSLQNQAFSELLLNPVADFIAASSLAALHSCYQKYFDTALNRLRQITSENKNYTVLRAQRYIKAHYPEALTLQSISDALQISPYYLCHIFKCSANTGVMEYLNTCRIEAAKKLLQAENMSVKDVAFRVGFSDPNYFCRVFKRTTSLTPSAFKNLENESSGY